MRYGRAWPRAQDLRGALVTKTGACSDAGHRAPHPYDVEHGDRRRDWRQSSSHELHIEFAIETVVDMVCRFRIIGNVEIQSALKALVGLAQGTRLSIFRLLVEQGPEGLSAGEIVERLQLANATASFHLKELTHARLATPRQSGRFIYYSANYANMFVNDTALTENCCKGRTCD